MQSDLVAHHTRICDGSLTFSLSLPLSLTLEIYLYYFHDYCCKYTIYLVFISFRWCETLHIVSFVLFGPPLISFTFSLFRTKAYKIPNTDIVFEEGTSIMFSISALQMDKNYYNEPEKFNVF